MAIFKPDIYKKDIFSIDFSKLKEDNIKCLIFDLDNTLGLLDDLKCPIKTKKLINELKKDFLVVIISNNTRGRIQYYLDDLEIDGVSLSMKPSIRGLIKIKNKYNLDKTQMCIIGDQMVTDIFAGNRYNIKTILVDPLGVKDLKITGLNRKIERYIINRYMKKQLFERGKYYG